MLNKSSDLELEFEMADLPVNKHYFVQTDPTFKIALEWISDELKAKELHTTGLHVTQLDHIYSQDIDNDNDKRWKNIYDFARTSSSTLRYIMLRVTGLSEYYKGDSFGKTALGRVEADLNQTREGPPLPPEYSTPINAGKCLAGNVYEAKWVAAHFDMLFPHFRIERRINGIKDGKLDVIKVNETRLLDDKMVVVNFREHIVWEFSVTLTVKRLRNAPNRKKRWRFKATPIIVVYRRELRPPQQRFTDYRFPVDHNDLDENIENTTQPKN